MWYTLLYGSLKARIQNLAIDRNRKSGGVVKGQNHFLGAVKLLEESP